MLIHENLAEINVSYHPTKPPAARRISITNSTDAVDVFRQIWNPDTIQLYEEFLVLFLDRKNGIIGFRNIGVGGTAGVVVNIKLIFAIALKVGCSGMILCHNHPSGNLKPSKADMELTKKINEASKFLELKLLDHLILTSDRYYSFADEGQIS